MPTFNSIQKILKPCICNCEEILNLFQKRLNQGKLTRDENPETHFCVYFLPYNPQNKKVFLVHHKKSNPAMQSAL